MGGTNGGLEKTSVGDLSKLRVSVLASLRFDLMSTFVVRASLGKSGSWDTKISPISFLSTPRGRTCRCIRLLILRSALLALRQLSIPLKRKHDWRCVTQVKLAVPTYLCSRSNVGQGLLIGYGNYGMQWLAVFCFIT